MKTLVSREHLNDVFFRDVYFLLGEYFLSMSSLFFLTSRIGLAFNTRRMPPVEGSQRPGQTSSLELACQVRSPVNSLKPLGECYVELLKYGRLRSRY
jgi:hypothetical protein